MPMQSSLQAIMCFVRQSFLRSFLSTLKGITMMKLRKLLIASAVLAFTHVALAQSAGTTGTTAEPAATGMPPAQTSNDPFVQKRMTDKAAKDEYKKRKKAARKEYKANKKAAKADEKAEKRDATQERNEQLTNQPKTVPATPG